MAAVLTTLTVDFNSNFTGQHRVCWRISPGIVYDCTTVVYCGGSGSPCSVSINISVDDESCDPVIYQGYVQAACNDVGSLSGRIPFTITFTPDPTCISYRVTCDNVGLLDITITNAGKGYDTVGAPPLISFSGFGTDTALASIGDSITIDNAGDGNYTDGNYFNVPYQTLTGIGVGGQANVAVVGGFITAITTIVYGADYYPTDTFTFLDANLGGGGGIGFTGSFDSNYSTVKAITLTPGTGNTSLPTVTIDPPISGTTATAVAILDVCVDQDLGTDCDGNPGATITGLELGQSAIECMQDLPIIDPEYTFIPEGCCYDCVNVLFDVDILSPVNADIYYVAYPSLLLTLYTDSPGGHGDFFAVNNSWYWNSDAIVIATIGGRICP